MANSVDPDRSDQEQSAPGLHFCICHFVRKLLCMKCSTIYHTRIGTVIIDAFVFRFQVIVMLRHANVDPTIVNLSGLKAVDLLPKGETKSLEHLRMAMYSGKHLC